MTVGKSVGLRGLGGGRTVDHPTTLKNDVYGNVEHGNIAEIAESAAEMEAILRYYLQLMTMNDEFVS